ncbi:transglycosylase domain-containing protein [Mangrovibacillus cuniculi]|uniref:PBP1A family penicillin-binding protein n=1 Tax=Mangrovibacillus cuniculi TaxID=2593652 RepID=A0A7S8HEP4_9BACI|nr:PBP1A family penicillin-binding protein [Mangrovibacillus cuniculi]QPC45953.1 PBP1A family penicillin-binding protein [Mangrovibacillus cuniculi]
MKGFIQKWWDKGKILWKKYHLTQWSLLFIGAAILSVLLFFFIMIQRTDLSSLRAGLAQATELYDVNEELASKVSANRMEGVEQELIPEHMMNAVIAIEDERFYEHGGYDVRGILRAAWTNMTSGGVVAGGSTVTQQLTKNAILSDERTLRRKVEELFLAVEIEKQYSKKEIMTMYLNQIYFGEGAWGIQRAAQTYFAKDAKDLTISESALIAGIIKAPSVLNPYADEKKAISRRNIVLEKMYDLGLIRSAEYFEALKEELVFKKGKPDPLKGMFPSYVDAVIEEAIKRYGLSENELLTRGYKIYTELDPVMQAGVEELYKDNSIFPADKGGEMVQSGAVFLNPETGGVRASVGGRGEHVFRGFNRATQLSRQPGSTFKPLAVYLPALEEGYTPFSILKDEQHSYGTYSPKNFSGQYYGDVTMYTALEKSLNASTVWLFNEIGPGKGMNALERLGFNVEKEEQQLGLALGGTNGGVSPLLMAQAYSTFANEGNREDAHYIRKIENANGEVLAEFEKGSTEVTSKEVVDQMNAMLLNVTETGTGSGVNVPGHQVAGKTGSTQLGFETTDGTKDQWFVGYTPNLVGAVWIGFDNTSEERYLSGASSTGVVPVFDRLMEQASKSVEPVAFDVTSINEQVANTRREQEEVEEQDERRGWGERWEKERKKIEKELQKEREKFEKWIDRFFNN